MTKKEYLGQVRQLDRKVGILMSELSALKALAAKVTSVMGGMPGSATRNTGKLENAVLKIIEQEEAIDEAIDAYVDKRREVFAALNEMEDSLYADILRMRYLDGRTWEKIAADLGFCERRVYTLHKLALDEFKIPAASAA